MKKAFQISLAGTLFHIEEDAYAKLNAYLEAVRARFAGAEGAEILRDIEARMAEQFMEAKKAVLSIDEVNAVVASMGTVEDIGGDSAPNATGSASGAQRVKKLYRDEDDAVLGGVCSGLARYFGTDAFWIRVGFIALTLITGFGILAYLAMWLIVPAARTASQKLEMAGEPVNLATLSDNIKERVEDARVRSSSRIGRVLAWPFEVIRVVFRFIIDRLLPLVGKTLVILFAVVGAAGIIAASIAAPVAAVQIPLHLFEVPMTEVIPLPIFYGLLACLYLAIVIPCVAILLAATGALRRNPAVRGWLGFMLAGVWLLAVMAGSGLMAHVVNRSERFLSTNPLYQEATRQFELAGDVSGVDAGDGIRVTVVNGAEQSLVATSDAAGLDGFSATVGEDGVLTLRSDNRRPACMVCNNRQVRVTLTVPAIGSISAQDGSRVEATSLSARSLTVEARDGSRVSLGGAITSATLFATDGSRIDLAGSTASTTMSASNGSRIEAIHATVGTANATARNGARIEFGVVESLEENEYSGGYIHVESSR